MIAFKALYQGMNDDLKDSDMMIKYACEIKDESPEDKDIADEIAKYAKERLEHFKDFHKMFNDHMEKMDTATTKRTVTDCLWDQTAQYMMDWHECIEKKINKYMMD